ncbi:MAG: hypothetical protein E8D46_02905 [Nitrospira sp.]|nr:MAG: hypothetical protein E8D46_02905 [Nitrospira sp.]
MRLRHGTWFVLAGLLWSCTTMPVTPPPASAPVFQADADDNILLQSVQREQELLQNTCAQNQSCDQVHFTQAMLALFQNGEAATASFQQTLADAPKGPLADSSTRWIQFLAHRATLIPSADEPTEALLEAMKGLVRTWLGQQRTASAAAAAATLRTAEPAKIQDQAVHVLQRRIRDREKRIAELTDQLSALKQIDLEAHRAGKLSPPGIRSK